MRHTRPMLAALVAAFVLAVPATAQAVAPRYAHARRHAFAFCELERLWKSVGPARYAHTMARLAIAESGGLPWVGSGYATGLWQIAGYPFRGDPRDPATNARMALAKLRRSHWRIAGPWAGSLGLPWSGYSDRTLVRRYGRAGFGRCGP